MTKKLLVITAGTVAASVGQEILQQMKAHPNSELDVMVRYIDTAFLPNRYGTLRAGEWFQMSISQRYIEAIQKKIKDFPRLEEMLFPGLLPGTDVSGGGSIRYNGAGAVEVQRENLQHWLSNSMADLAQRGDGETAISMALILSAVGATGSGSLEHLLEVIIDAAHHAKIKSTTQSTIRCDIYILQPGIHEVTDLGLANTLALYAELAASQLTLHTTTERQYQGRKIMVDWGSNFALSSIDQLKETAATLVRLSSDSSSNFPAEYQEREVDNHVLRELDPLSNLPMHLSTATVVTISLGDLVEKVIQRDVADLIKNLVFGKPSGEPSNIFLGKLSQALAGESAPARYRKLLEFLSGIFGLNRMRSRLDGVLGEQGTSAGEKVNRLQSVYLESQREIKQNSKNILDQGRRFIDDTLRDMERSKYELISKGLSLAELRAEYSALENVVNSIHEEALKDIQTTKVNDESVHDLIAEINAPWPRNLVGRQEKLDRLVSLMKRNLQGQLHETAREAAFDVLDALLNYSAKAGLNLEVVLEKVRKQRDNQEGWAAAYRELKVDTDHPLHIMALSTQEEIKTYTDKISIFSARSRTRTSTLAGATGAEQLADFRRWLADKDEFEALFEGDVDLLASVATSYTSERVLAEVKNRSVVDVLLEAGDGVLLRRLEKAADKAISLVSFDKDFAPDRREAWHVSIDYGTDPVKRDRVAKIMREAVKQGKPKLLKSDDPTEIAVYYYVDGIPMSAVDDLKGRCLKAFLKRRQQWNRQQASLNGNVPVSSLGSFNQRVGVPVYSGRDTERRVKETCVIQRLYEVRGKEVGNFKIEDIPELECEQIVAPNKQEELVELKAEPTPSDQNGQGIHHGTPANGNGHTPAHDNTQTPVPEPPLSTGQSGPTTPPVQNTPGDQDSPTDQGGN